MQTSANVALGMTLPAARARAHHQFGSLAQHKDDYRDRWGARHFEAFRQDLRAGVRQACARPGTPLALIVALALGIGASTAVFSVFNGVRLTPLPYQQADGLVRLQAANDASDSQRLLSAAEVRDLRAGVRSLASVAEFHYMYFILLGGREPQRVSAGVVSSNFFDVLGVAPILGRTFLPEEEVQGAPGVIVLSHRHWRHSFNADPRVIGRRIEMNDRTHTIVGVLPPLPSFPEQADIYMPTVACPLRSSPAGDIHRDMHLVSALGRAGSSPADPAAMQNDLRELANRLTERYPDAYGGRASLRLSAVPAIDDLTSRFHPTLAVLMASAAFLLLSLAASTGALVLAGALRRRPQVAMQAALGAARGRLLRQFATESLAVTAVGTAVGVGIASASLPLLVTLAARFTSRSSDIHLDGRALAFAVLLGLAMTMLFAIVIAFGAFGRPWRRGEDGMGALGHGRSVTTRHPFFKGLVIVQIGVAFALLVGAGLTVRSVFNLERIDTGYRAANVLTLRLSADTFKYATYSGRVALFERVLQAVRRVGGVDAASLSGALPLTSSGNLGEDIVEARGSSPAAAGSLASLQAVSSQYLRTVGLELLEGRDFVETDILSSERVVIVNRELARRHWGTESAVGRHLRVGDDQWLTVVGVVADARQRLDRAPMDEVFGPLSQLPFQRGSLGRHGAVSSLVQARLFVRSRFDAAALEPALRSAIREVEPEQAIDGQLTLEGAREQTIAPLRLTAILIAIFAAIGLVLSTIGVGGVVAASVAARRREFGLRSAVGGNRRQILLGVLKEGAALTSGGVLLGLVMALALARVLRALLFEVPPHDVVTFFAVGVLLVAVTIGACLAPARHAARVDPNAALRAS
jgi:predicted permease